MLQTLFVIGILVLLIVGNVLYLTHIKRQAEQRQRALAKIGSLEETNDMGAANLRKLKQTEQRQRALEKKRPLGKINDLGSAKFE